MGEEESCQVISAYSPEQAELLPRHVRDELPGGHLSLLIHEVVEGLDLSHFDEAYIVAARGSH